MCKKPKSSPKFVECEGQFISKPHDIANYFNKFSTRKVANLRSNMTVMHAGTQDAVEKLLQGLSPETSAGIDHLEGRILKVAATQL